MVRASIFRITKVVLGFFVILICLYLFALRPLLVGNIDLPEKKGKFLPSPQTLQDHVVALTSLQPSRNERHLDSLNQAATYIFNQWEQMGFKPEFQIYQIEGREYKNVIVKIGPPTKEVVVIGAHYDVCGEQPGADDNASGVAGLLELSRLVIQNKPDLKHEIQFVAYTLEEPPTYDSPFMGSYIHAQSLKNAGNDVLLMLSLEMIGYYSDEPNSQSFPIPLLKLDYPRVGNFIAIISNMHTRELVKNIKRAMISHSDIPVFSMNSFEFVEGIDYSDHRSYWHFGFENSAMITDTSFFRNHHYHMKTDTADTLDYTRMAEVVSGLYGVVLDVGLPVEGEK